MKLIWFFFIVAVVQSAQGRILKMDLADALNTGRATAEFRSAGGYSGYCMNLYIRNNSKDSLVINVHAGLKLTAGKDVYQDILIVKSSEIRLRRGEKQVVVLKGYCCQLDNLSPPSDLRYNIDNTCDSALVVLAEFLDTTDFSEDAEQDAVWCVSDDRPTAAIAAADDSLSSILVETVAQIKNEPLPWYSVVVVRNLHRNGSIELMPNRIRGVINYDAAKISYGRLTLINSAGFPEAIIKEQWLREGEHNGLDIDIDITGLVSGDYTFELSTGDTLVAKREFRI